MFVLLLFALLPRRAKPTPFLPLFFSPPEISSFWEISTAITPLGFKRHFRPPWGEVFDPAIFYDFLSLNDSDISTLLHRSSGVFSCHPSLDISFASSSFALSCFWEVLQNLGSNHQTVLVTVPLFQVLRPNKRPPFFNFQKVH